MAEPILVLVGAKGTMLWNIRLSHTYVHKFAKCQKIHEWIWGAGSRSKSDVLALFAGSLYGILLYMQHGGTADWQPDPPCRHVLKVSYRVCIGPGKSLKVLEFNCWHFQAWKVLGKSIRPGKPWKSPGILKQMSWNFEFLVCLCNISRCSMVPLECKKTIKWPELRPGSRCNFL